MDTPLERGTTRMREGRYREAADELADAVALDAQDVAAWRLLGGALIALGELNGAVAAFERTVALAPNIPKNHYNLGLALQKSGAWAAAREHFTRALLLDPNYKPAQVHLAEWADVPLPAPPPVSSPPRYQPSPGGYVPPPTLGYGQHQLPPPPQDHPQRNLVIAAILFILALLFFGMRFSR